VTGTLIDFVSKYSVVRKIQLTAGADMGMPRPNEAGSVLELDSGIPLMDKRRPNHTTLVGL